MQLVSRSVRCCHSPTDRLSRLFTTIVRGGPPMKRRLWLSLLIVVLLSIAACQNPNAPAAGQPAAGEANTPAAAAGTTAGVSEFHSAWPYDPPPVGHYNTFVPGSLALGIY